MSEIVALKGVVMQSDRKSAWLDLVAQLYDSFCEKHDREPGSVAVFMLCDRFVEATWDIGEPWRDIPAGAHAAMLIFADHLMQSIGDE